MSFLDEIKLRLYIKKLKFKKIKRDQSTISLDYDQGVWNKKYDDIDFESLIGMYGKNPEESALFVKDGKLINAKRELSSVRFGMTSIKMVIKSDFVIG